MKDLIEVDSGLSLGIALFCASTALAMALGSPCLQNGAGMISLAILVGFAAAGTNEMNPLLTLGRGCCAVTAALWLLRLWEERIMHGGGFFQAQGWASLGGRLIPIVTVLALAGFGGLPLPGSLFSIDRVFFASALIIFILAALDALLRAVRIGPEFLFEEYRRGGGKALAFALLGALSEELLFRGVLLSSLLFFGKTVAVTGQAFLFALFHSRRGYPSGAKGTVMTFLLGLFLGALTLEGGSILAAALVHGAGIPYLLRILAAAGWRAATLDRGAGKWGSG